MEQVKPLYGMWCKTRRKFVFGIKEKSKKNARRSLFRKVGPSAMGQGYEARLLNPPPVRKVSKEELNQVAEEIIAILKYYGVVIQRYDSYSTKSIYLKFDYGVCNSLRISDHKGKKHLSYRYNMQSNITHAHTTLTRKNWERHYFPLEEAEKMAYKILDDREAKIRGYGLGLYKQFMYDNMKNNEHNKGFWEQAKIV